MTGSGSGEAAQALREAIDAIGLEVDPASLADSSVDIVVINSGGNRVAVQIKRLSLATLDGLARRIDRWNRELSPEAAIGVVVADRITEQARRVLRESGWGWLDLRGHLHIAGHGLFIDADVPLVLEASTHSTPFAGQASTEVAASLLLDPLRPAAVRAIARTLNRAPSTVSNALAALSAAGLVDQHRKPVLPALFWELADRWRPQQVPVNSVPSPPSAAPGGSANDLLRLGLEDVENTTGWALTDTLAAADYGAPVGVRSDYPPDFYVPDRATQRRAVHLLGVARDHSSRAANIRIAPIPLICSHRVDGYGGTWPLARPLFVALDLAQDPGRGREILDAWTPGDAGHRVW